MATKKPNPKSKKATAKSKVSPSAVAPFPTNDDHETPPGGGSRTPAVFRVQGPMSTFGGPHDFGMKPDEGLALFQRADLNNSNHSDLFLPRSRPEQRVLAGA